MTMPSSRSLIGRTFTGAALVAVASLTLTGCGADSSTATKEGSSSAQTSSAATTPLAQAQGLIGNEGTAKDATADQAVDLAPKVAMADQYAPARLTLTQIRVGVHEGKDRVVFEFGGTGTPGYDVQYVDSPAQQGSGQALSVPGSSFLQVTATGQALPMDSGLTEVPRGTVAAPQGSGVAGVDFAGQFEGRAQSVIGLTGPRKPFTVFTLTGPTRLVVDIER